MTFRSLAVLAALSVVVVPAFSTPEAADSAAGWDAAGTAAATALTATLWHERVDEAIAKNSRRLLTKAARIYRHTRRS